MKVTPRYLVQLSSAEIALLHGLVQRQVRALVAERPQGRGLDSIIAPPELIALDRRLLMRLQEVTDHEEAYFAGRRARPEAAWIAEEHAALAEGLFRQSLAALPATGAYLPGEPGDNVMLLRKARRHGIG